MAKEISVDQLVQAGLEFSDAKKLEKEINACFDILSGADCWQKVSQEILKPNHPFELHTLLYQTVYASWDVKSQGPPPAWIPTKGSIEKTNLARLMDELALISYEELYLWSIQNREVFWDTIIKKLDIPFVKEYRKVVDLSLGVESPQWLVDAKMNIAESCFNAPDDATAIVYQPINEPIYKLTYRELEILTNRVANGLQDQGFAAGDAIGIAMPMTMESVAIYLGIIKAGCVVVSIADSFAPAEIEKRLAIAKTKGLFTQDIILRSGKTLPMYEKVLSAHAPLTIVLPCFDSVSVNLRFGDLVWNDFLSDKEPFEAVACSPHDHTNILFSSGTTGDPKAIAFSHTSPIKCVADAYLHHDIQAEDVIAWPTNLGWMMGPWLIYAGLVNKATIALYGDAPNSKEFGRFIQNSKVTMLGVIPSMVKSWKNTSCMKDLDWSAIKAFSSTGECSNSEEMLYLMLLAGYKPVIEYCGGTEIGGGYITGTLIQPASPSTFTTPALGVELMILDEKGKESDSGEVFLVGPSIGLSGELINEDHYEIYFSGTPKGPHGEILRRHGDQIEKLAGGYYRAHGRIDDTMNLGGIKVSSVEIERTLNRLEGVHETAAIAITDEGEGSSSLIIFVVLSEGFCLDKQTLMEMFQQTIKEKLNPLFKIADVVVVDNLPRTTTNKIMRRKLRAKYQKV